MRSEKGKHLEAASLSMHVILQLETAFCWRSSVALCCIHPMSIGVCGMWCRNLYCVNPQGVYD